MSSLTNQVGLQEESVPVTRQGAVKQQNLHPEDPFKGYFNPSEEAPGVEPMLKSRVAARWMRDIHSMISGQAYLFQQTMTSKSGPEVFSNNRDMYMLSSYDYLGLLGHPYIENATIEAVRRYGTGTGGARMLAGTNQLHRQLEAKIAAFKGKEDVISFSSGYMANLAAINTLIQKTDRVIIDELVHRSLIDALSMAQLNYEKCRHNDMGHLRSLLETEHPGKKTFIITEGIFSMEGDICPLPEIVALKKEFNAYILLDESHSLGVLGATGRGVDEHFGISPDDIDIYTSAMSKSVPVGGGFIATSKQAVIFMQHAASPFLFSCAMSPANTAACLSAFEMIEKEGPERIAKVFENTAYLKSHLNRLGYNTGHTESPILPVIIGDKEKTLRLSTKLYELGFLANPVIFPAIPPGGDRLRLCATAAQSKLMLDEVIFAFDLAREVL
ncbi:MAG TPA: aminotransferase class I/II-fold pyridoxal phosphate-dependent enzyme [Chitinophagaceae bacterium]|nr:aminotransferase class I/II-fold pyridoxal phosphate-dependent enzyme [Chitinophagaceae bacterium]